MIRSIPDNGSLRFSCGFFNTAEEIEKASRSSNTCYKGEVLMLHLDYRSGSLLGFLILVADIWAILSVVQSGATNGAKALWVALILFFPWAVF